MPLKEKICLWVKESADRASKRKGCVGMKKKSKLLVALMISLCMVATFALAGCNGGNNGQQDQGQEQQEQQQQQQPQQLSGTVTGNIGVLYATKWFTFTVNSMSTNASFENYNAADGYTLVIANVTITNTFGATQPFGTFDWFVDDESLTRYIYPLDPLGSNMMPTQFDLNDGDTVTYNVVIEYPSDLADPYFMFVEVDEENNLGAAFRLSIK
jgi:hypothetical protein